MVDQAASPRFSVVIPTCRRSAELACCLERLQPGAQANLQATWEVIVSDDGGDASAEELLRTRFPWARWTPGPRKGPATNRNHGASLATGEWLVFVDDDCLPSADWLSGFENAIRASPAFRVFEGRTSVPRPRERLLETAPVNESGGFLWACNFAIRRDFFIALGGFDPRFPYPAMEDSDLRQRIQASGESFSFVPAAQVVHPWRPTDSWRAFLVQRHAESLYAQIHPEMAPLVTVRYWLRFYALVFVRDSWRDWLRYPLEMLRSQPRYTALQLSHLWALLTRQGPTYFQTRIDRLDRARTQRRHAL